MQFGVGGRRNVDLKQTLRSCEERCHLVSSDRIDRAVVHITAAECHSIVGDPVDVVLVDVVVVISEPVGYGRREDLRSSKEGGHLVSPDEILRAIVPASTPERNPCLGDGIDVVLVDAVVVVIEPIGLRRVEGESVYKKGRHLRSRHKVERAVLRSERRATGGDSGLLDGFDGALMSVPVVIDERASRRQFGGRDESGSGDE